MSTSEKPKSARTALKQSLLQAPVDANRTIDYDKPPPPTASKKVRHEWLQRSVHLPANEDFFNNQTFRTGYEPGKGVKTIMEYNDGSGLNENRQVVTPFMPVGGVQTRISFIGDYAYGLGVESWDAVRKGKAQLYGPDKLTKSSHRLVFVFNVANTDDLEDPLVRKFVQKLQKLDKDVVKEITAPGRYIKNDPEFMGVKSADGYTADIGKAWLVAHKRLRPIVRYVPEKKKELDIYPEHYEIHLTGDVMVRLEDDYKKEIPLDRQPSDEMVREAQLANIKKLYTRIPGEHIFFDRKNRPVPYETTLQYEERWKSLGNISATFSLPSVSGVQKNKYKKAGENLWTPYYTNLLRAESSSSRLELDCGLLDEVEVKPRAGYDDVSDDEGPTEEELIAAAEAEEEQRVARETEVSRVAKELADKKEAEAAALAAERKAAADEIASLRAYNENARLKLKLLEQSVANAAAEKKGSSPGDKKKASKRKRERKSRPSPVTPMDDAEEEEEEDSSQSFQFPVTQTQPMSPDDGHRPGTSDEDDASEEEEEEEEASGDASGDSDYEQPSIMQHQPEVSDDEAATDDEEAHKPAEQPAKRTRRTKKLVST